jgi:hypothetical protein
LRKLECRIVVKICMVAKGSVMLVQRQIGGFDTHGGYVVVLNGGLRAVTALMLGFERRGILVGLEEGWEMWEVKRMR